MTGMILAGLAKLLTKRGAWPRFHRAFGGLWS
jgi:hypothetical protein